MALGYIPGVTKPPLGGAPEPLEFPLIITMPKGFGFSPVPRPPPVLRLTGPPPVLALTNFPETSAVVEVFGAPVAMTIANTAGPNKDMLFALSLPACRAFHGCPNPATSLIALLNALHPANSVNLQLSTAEMSACVLKLTHGTGVLGSSDVIALLNDLACSDHGIFGSQIAELLDCLISAGSEPLTATELYQLVRYLKSPVEPLRPQGILTVVKFLRKQLSPGKILTLVLRLQAGASGITGQKLRALLAGMLTSEVRILPFAALVNSMLAGGNEITAREFDVLIGKLRAGDACNSKQVTAFLELLRSHLNPTETQDLCLLFLDAGVHPLAPKELCTLTGLVLDPQHNAESIDSSHLRRLARWFLTGLSPISPQAVCEITTGFLTPTVKPKQFFGFIEFLVGSLNPLTPVQFLDIVTRLQHGGDSLDLNGVGTLCGKMKAQNASPLQILALLDLASAANVFHPKNLLALVNQCHKETIGGLEMLTTCQQLVIAGPTGLNIAETLALVKLLRKPIGALSGTQIVTLVTGLRTALDPKQTEEVLGLCLGAASIDPTAVLALYNLLCTGGSAITPLRMRILCRRYLPALTPKQFSDLLLELAPFVNGLNPAQIDPLLMKLGASANGASPAQVHGLLTALLAGGSALNPVQIHGMVDSLIHTLAVPAGLSGIQCFTLLDRLLTGDNGANNGLNPTQTRQLVQSIRVSFSPQDLNVLVTRQAQVGQVQVTLSPTHLHHRCQTVNFIANAAAACPAHVTLNELHDILCEAQSANVPPAQIVTILQHLPNYYSNANHNKAWRVKKFIRGAKGQGATWADIVTWLGYFIADGRAPFGAAYTPYAQTGINTAGIPMDINQIVNIGTPTDPYQISVRVSQNRVNYFCNSHTFRYFDFGSCGRASQISFWGAGVTRAAVILAITAALNNGTLLNMLREAEENPTVYTGTDRVSQYSEGDSGGIYYDNSGIFYLHHFHAIGGGGFSIKREILQALAFLFQP